MSDNRTFNAAEKSRHARRGFFMNLVTNSLDLSKEYVEEIVRERTKVLASRMIKDYITSNEFKSMFAKILDDLLKDESSLLKENISSCFLKLVEEEITKKYSTYVKISIPKNKG